MACVDGCLEGRETGQQSCGATVECHGFGDLRFAGVYLGKQRGGTFRSAAGPAVSCQVAPPLMELSRVLKCNDLIIRSMGGGFDDPQMMLKRAP